MAISATVVGAGAFGGWTALFLLRAGARVTLIDAWGPGNSRASSGDETRVIRASYGPNAIYTEMVARAIPLCQAVMESFVAENGVYVQGFVQPEELAAFPADVYVFACGPWLGQLFPDVLGGAITSTRQETFYFGTPAGDIRFNEDRFPTWVDN